MISAETVKSLSATGFFRLLQPARFGGCEADPVTFFGCVRDIAAACGSTGWVASVIGVHNWQMALFPDRAQQDVWGDDPGTLMSSSYAPTGKISAVDGGYRVSGRWSFSSGSDHASWALLGGIVPGEGDTPADFRTFLIPAADYTIEDVWHTIGLRGTGSNDIVVADAFVPAYRSLSFGDTARCVCPGQELNTAPLYRIPYGSIFPNTITTPIVGMATGAYHAHVTYMRERVRAAYAGVRAAEDPYSQVRVARAAADVDAAWLALTTDMNELMALVTAGERPPMRLRLRVRRNQVRGTELAIAAVDRLFENSGGRAIYTSHPMQRYWRDAHAGRVHAINDPERALSMYGRGEFGLSVADAMV
ncbi:acyl-CoA dehydrogenase [Actinoplanes sp. L3-i22]|nr:acyl-CoA dehydrogenase [Actinoplanes sp. L3-i22]